MPLLVEIEVEERLLDDALTAEWQQNFYCLTSPVDVAGHLTYNLIQGRRLSSLDGFADQPESAARILDIHVEDDDTQELPRHAWAGGALQIREGSQGREYNWECTCGMTGEEWYAIPRHATRSYQRHLVNGARAPEASPK